MSVINQMLKDLEKRAKSSQPPAIALPEVYKTMEWRARRKKIIWMSGGFIFFSLTFFSIFFLLFHYPILSQEKVVLPEIAAPKIITTDAQFTNNFVNSAVLTGITLQTQADMTFLRFLLNQNVLYRVGADVKKQRLIVTLEHTRLLTSVPPINYTNSAIKNMIMINQKNGDLKIILTLQPETSLQHFAINIVGKWPELQIDILQKNANFIEETQIKHKNRMKKVIVDMTAEEEYQRALSFVTANQNNTAIDLLEALVQKSPGFLLARQTLVSLLVQQNKRVKAEQFLQIGLEQQPNYLPFIEIKARMLADAGKTASALSWLERASPSMAEHPDYYALIAALYQRQGHAAIAAKLYEKLLTLKPDNALWWMGLAIADETLGEHIAAQTAYARADNSDKLSPELKAYIETRMNDNGN